MPSNLKDLRKVLKPLGFTVTTRAASFGRIATYKHLESGELLTYNVFTAEQLAKWRPIINFRNNNQAALKLVRISEDCIGLE